MGWFLVGLVAVGVAAVFVLLLRRAPRARARQLLDQAAVQIGAPRVGTLIDCLQVLAGTSPLVLVSLWPELEGRLLAALPDCPPAEKPRLVAALEACHAITDHRQTQRGLMDLRRSLMG